MSLEVLIVDYHKGNLLSVARSLSDAGACAVISDEPERIRNARALVLPGVGSFEDAMSFLDRAGMADALKDALGRGVPFLGICLGQQLLVDEGEEAASGSCAGLGIVRGRATKLTSTQLKVPHVGWDQITLSDQGGCCPLFEGVADGANLYFTHSYALGDDIDPDFVSARTNYTRNFASAIWNRQNIFGVQFHPEKSSQVGLRILKNFVRFAGEYA